jgi:peptidoglycan/LPS O-acetylase OafA/YrhL
LPTSPPAAVASRPAEPRDKKAFRPDIQGLRAFGLFVMFLCHAEFGFGSGGFVGLDIFFVISGFLITGLIVHELDRTGTLSLSAFYARRIRRLLPLAVTVLAVTVVASWFAYSPLQAEVVAGDVIAASLYFVNWRFAAQETDYFAVDPLDSPIQHFWSLSVEEQFYLVWPLLLLTAFAFVARRSGRWAKPALWASVALIGVPSLVYSALIIDLESHASYFSTLARMWEFALGGALALLLPKALELPRAVVALLAWGGVAVILVTTIEFDRNTPYPGTAALWPTLATAAIVVAGTVSVGSTLPMRVLASRTFQYVGDISYAWYLWHWPALVFARAAWGDLSSVESLGVIALSWIPSAISHAAIENRFRYGGGWIRRPRYALGFGVACIGAAAVMAAGLVAVQPKIQVAESHEVEGAAAAEDPQKRRSFQRVARVLMPTPAQAKDDRGKVWEDGCLVREGAGPESPPCVYGDRYAKRTAVLFGDSHAMHYFPALERVALNRGWRLVVLTRASCTAASVAYDARCDRWRERALQRIEVDERPRMVMVGTSTTSPTGVLDGDRRLDREESEPDLEAGYRKTLERLRETGARVVVLGDTPRADKDVADCVSSRPRRLEECVFDDTRRLDGQFDVRAARDVPGVTIVDTAELICPDRRCAPVIGNALVLRDSNHMTATFAATLHDWLAQRLPEFG